MEQSKSLTPRAREMYTVIEKFQSSGLTQRAFCDQIDIKLATFQKWLHHFRKNNQSGERKKRISDVDFIPIEIKAASEKASQVSTYTIEYPSGIILRISGTVDITAIERLLSRAS